MNVTILGALLVPSAGPMMIVVPIDLPALSLSTNVLNVCMILTAMVLPPLAPLLNNSV